MRTILVTGASGNQGGATARHLLKDGWHVRALVRDPARAKDLAEAGAELVVGDMSDRASLDAAVDGAYGVFSVQPPDGPAFDEYAAGVNVADAALAAGVRHFVYTSVGAAERTDVPGHPWYAKHRIEAYLAGLDGLPTTSLRPVMFMENHLNPVGGAFGEMAVLRLVPAGSRLQLIAVEDIGAFAAIVFGDPEQHIGRAYELAGDELSRDELVQLITEAAGRAPDLSPHSPETLAKLNLTGVDLSASTSFGGWRADIPALRRIHPRMWTFQDWLDNGAAERFRALSAG